MLKSRFETFETLVIFCIHQFQPDVVKPIKECQNVLQESMGQADFWTEFGQVSTLHVIFFVFFSIHTLLHVNLTFPCDVDARVSPIFRSEQSFNG